MAALLNHIQFLISQNTSRIELFCTPSFPKEGEEKGKKKKKNGGRRYAAAFFWIYLAGKSREPSDLFLEGVGVGAVGGCGGLWG